MELNSKVPTGPIEQQWDKHKADSKLVNPANKRKFRVIVVEPVWPEPRLQPPLPNLATM